MPTPNSQQKNVFMSLYKRLLAIRAESQERKLLKVAEKEYPDLDESAKHNTQSLLSRSGPIVSLTTHGKRFERVHITIESIARGTLKPSRVILWVDDDNLLHKITDLLAKQIKRGLEIKKSTNYGPHTKYYPTLLCERDESLPLVTADDDIIYPVGWLEDLFNSYKAAKSAEINCFRARRVKVRPDGSGLCPYEEWGFARDTQGSYLNFATGVSGVIYPPAFLEILKSSGDKFMACCPKADDIWLHKVAIENGYLVRQIENRPVHMPVTPETQAQALMASNVSGGGNDKQIKDTYSTDNIRLLIQASAR
jgi:hypothetical protein